MANILIAAEDSALAQELLQKIRRHGYDGRAVTSLDAALATVQQEHPDIVLATETLIGGTAVGLAMTLRKTAGCAEIPICLAAATRSVEIKQQALSAGIDDVLFPPLDEIKLVARLRPLVRLAIMRSELHQRAQTARRFGVDVLEEIPVNTTPTGYPLLVVGPEGASLSNMLSGARLSFASDPFVADDLLSRNNFDAAILVPDANPEPYLDLCAQARNNPRLFNLPVLIVSDLGRIGEEVAYHHGASGFFANPVNPLELQTSVLSQVRRQQARWSVRRALAETLQASTRDAETGVYARSFLDAYLMDRVKFSGAHGRNLSIMFFCVPDIEGVRLHFGEAQARHLRLQVSQWITGLLRGEDVTARYAENEFCVVLPDTPKSEAEVVMHRIAGVLAYTDFAVKDVYQPVKIWARVGSADLLPDDSVSTLTTRARANIV
ncbi:diguanylate cyclase [Telmatospirillum sp.]|uniref:diguanylate cyclase n=1 Tax=Telmatospirillum sp. TaxID=2079197 RepID=UPI00284835DF|nr:diguanylate cyclase [Telmatospirillum sp.]MDR3435473.1 diguanylate cyclase [Telmatospirillum sp.]